MASFQISEIVACVDGKLLQGDPGGSVRGVFTDSRQAKRGGLFIAIVGKKHDAHKFIPQVTSKKPAAVLVSRKIRVPDKKIAVIQVADTTRALGQLAGLHRQRFRIPVIAITGSAGKTTTKELIAAVLKTKYKVLKNAGTENNQFGVPLTLLKLASSHTAAVIEVGTNRPGDIPWLASIVRPTIAIITNIGESHLELLRSPREVFNEKFSLVKALDKKGTAVVNADDQYLKTIPKSITQKCFTFGVRQDADFQARDLKMSGHGVEFKAAGIGRVALKGVSTAMVYNALIAICCGRMLRIGYNDIKKGIEAFTGHAGRQGLTRVGRITLIDDTYNANPVSFRSSLQAVSQLKVKGKRVLVCGDMLELGEQAERLHKEIGRLAGRSGIDAVLSYGKFSRHISVTAGFQAPGITVLHSEDEADIFKKLQSILGPGDVVLIKGSRGMRMERFVDFIKKKFKRS